MENLISRYRNVSVLVAILFAQMLLLGVQVKRTEENTSTRLIRVWTVDAITPFEKGIVRIENATGGLWHEYFYLRGVRQENRDLRQQIEHMQLEQVRLKDDADQARRLQSLLGFKEQFISQTLAAQVIGSSGSEHSRLISIDKGSDDGIRRDMPVISADGVIGKVLRVFGSTSQVLLIDDQTSGVGTILEQSRLQGVLKGTPNGEVALDKIMNDEQVQPGEKVFTSGGDEIFPKGLLVGTVEKATHGPESFLSIRVKPAADLSRLEEVLIITKDERREPDVASAPSRAADILARRLPSVPEERAETGGSKGGDRNDKNAGESDDGQAPAAVKPQTAGVQPEAGDGAHPVAKMPTPSGTVNTNSEVKVSPSASKPPTVDPPAQSDPAKAQAPPQ